MSVYVDKHFHIYTDDADGRVEVTPDGDGFGLIEVKHIGSDGIVTGPVFIDPAMSHAVAEAIVEVAKVLAEQENEEKAG